MGSKAGHDWAPEHARDTSACSGRRRAAGSTPGQMELSHSTKYIYKPLLAGRAAWPAPVGAPGPRGEAAHPKQSPTGPMQLLAPEVGLGGVRNDVMLLGEVGGVVINRKKL